MTESRVVLEKLFLVKKVLALVLTVVVGYHDNNYEQYSTESSTTRRAVCVP